VQTSRIFREMSDILKFLSGGDRAAKWVAQGGGRHHRRR